METDWDFDPGGNRSAVAHGRQEVPRADRCQGGAVERMVAAAAMQDDLDGGAGGIEANPHQGLALLVELDGARRIGGRRRWMAETWLAFPDDCRSGKKTRGRLLGIVRRAEIR